MTGFPEERARPEAAYLLAEVGHDLESHRLLLETSLVS
jgi:hypothetical protein